MFVLISACLNGEVLTDESDPALTIQDAERFHTLKDFKEQGTRELIAHNISLDWYPK